MKKCKKTLLLFIVTVMTASTFLSSQVSAVGSFDYEALVAKPGEDLIIHYFDENTWEYYQEIDGQVFKIEESINPDTKVVTSFTSSVDTKGKLNLEKTTIITPKEDVVEFKTEENGEISTYIHEINSGITVEETASVLPGDYGTFSTLTPWRFTYNRYNPTANLWPSITVGGATTLLGAAMKWSLPTALLSVVVSAAVAHAATNMVHTPVYTRHQRSHKNITGTTILAGIKDEVWIYGVSNYTSLITFRSHTECLNGYSCR